MAKPKVKISERAAIQRINRKLKVQDEKLCTARMFSDGQFMHENTDLGRYYVIDVRRNFVVNTRVDLQGYGRELGAIAEWEELAE
jgi:hypothetical protein